MNDVPKRIDGIYNMMEAVVWDMLLSVAKDNNEVCFCSECRRDMAAYALNRLPSCYVSTAEGEGRFINSDVSVDNVITEAIHHVSKNPHRGNVTMTKYSVNQLFERLKDARP